MREAAPLLDELAVRRYAPDAERIAARDDVLHLYNHHRHSTALGDPPITRLHTAAGQHN